MYSIETETKKILYSISNKMLRALKIQVYYGSDFFVKLLKHWTPYYNFSLKTPPYLQNIKKYCGLLVIFIIK